MTLVAGFGKLYLAPAVWDFQSAGAIQFFMDMNIELLNRIQKISAARKELGHVSIWDITLHLNEAGEWCLCVKKWSGDSSPLIDEPVTEEAVQKLFKIIFEEGMKHIGGLSIVQQANHEALAAAYAAIKSL